MASAASSQELQSTRQPLQDANGHHHTPQLLPTPSLQPFQPQGSDLALHGNAPALHGKEAGSITVGSIANAYFASAPGEGMSTWGRSQHGPEASQSHGLDRHPGFGSFQSPAAASPSTDHGYGSNRANVMPFASNYMNGIPLEADTVRRQPSQRDSSEPLRGVQRHDLNDMLAAANSRSHGLHATLGVQRQIDSSSGKQAPGRGGSTASSNANSRRGKTSGSGQQAAKAAANSPGRKAKHAEAAAGRKAQPAARSPPRYHETRCIV